MSLQISLHIQERLEKGKSAQLMQMEASSFFHYLEREMSCTDKVYISKKRMFFYCDQVRYDYKLNGNYIVREVDSKGWIEVCLYVKEFDISPTPGGIKIKLIMQRGTTKWQAQTILAYSL
ncbi:hypothetical protein EIZ39_05685 [Ammoniphilus sp. CFH 90114]|nr:hypothetical protein EIZ39_05685 [Ammoniphilus sp. CFH 90114]